MALTQNWNKANVELSRLSVPNLLPDRYCTCATEMGSESGGKRSEGNEMTHSTSTTSIISSEERTCSTLFLALTQSCKWVATLLARGNILLALGKWAILIFEPCPMLWIFYHRWVWSHCVQNSVYRQTHTDDVMSHMLCITVAGTKTCHLQSCFYNKGSVLDLWKEVALDIEKETC